MIAYIMPQICRCLSLFFSKTLTNSWGHSRLCRSLLWDEAKSSLSDFLYMIMVDAHEINRK